MIAFGCAVVLPEAYELRAKPGIERAAESDSAILVHAAAGSIARGYNLMLESAARLEDLEALVLLHQDAELLDGDAASKLRSAFADPDVAVVGCLGARNVRDMAWWDGEVTWNSAPYRHGEFGGGDLKPRVRTSPQQAPGEVESIYGVVIALSAWAVRNLRFDESLGMLHGYDFDICRQAREAGRKVLTVDLAVAHHHSLDVVTQVETWIAAHMRAAELWENDGPDSVDEWRPRAREAEAAAAAARLLAASKLLQIDAVTQFHAREIETLVNSRSWRLTQPLRRANALVGAVRSRISVGQRPKHLVP